MEDVISRARLKRINQFSCKFEKNMHMFINVSIIIIAVLIQLQPLAFPLDYFPYYHPLGLVRSLNLSITEVQHQQDDGWLGPIAVVILWTRCLWI